MELYFNTPRDTIRRKIKRRAAYINELGQFLRIDSFREPGVDLGDHFFATIALGLWSPFARLWFLGSGDNRARETFSEDAIVVIGGHWIVQYS
jgi:hypothetical protein